MADSRHRADVTSRTRAPESWDAGLHADSERGTIDLGLCVEPTALGLVLEVPDFGVLRLGFDLGLDGETRLASGLRTLVDGRVIQLVAHDEGRALRLETSVQRLEASLAQAISERDDARAQALALHDAKSAAQAQLEALQAEQRLATERAAAALQSEQDQRLVALGEREKARADLERLRGELDAGSTTLVREVSEARAARDAAEEGARRLSAELLELSSRLKSLGDQHEQLVASKKELEQQHVSAAAELEASRRALTTSEDASRAEVERLCVELAEVSEALSQARAAALAEEARLHDELAEATQSLIAAQAAATADHLAASSENERLHDELAEATAALSAAQAAASASQATASAENERLHDELAEATQALTIAQTGANATYEASRAENERLCDELAAATEALTAARAAAMAEEARLHEELGAATEALSAACAGALEEKKRLEAALSAATSQAASAQSEARRALQRQTELASTLEDVRTKQAAAEAEVAALTARSSQQPEPVPLGGSPAATTERLAVLQVRVDEAQVALAAEREQTETAREVARQLKLQLEKLTRERDEARTVARQLHQKMAAHGVPARDGSRSGTTGLAESTGPGGRTGAHDEPRPGRVATTQPAIPSFVVNETETDPGHDVSPPRPPTRKTPEEKKR